MLTLRLECIAGLRFLFFQDFRNYVCVRGWTNRHILTFSYSGFLDYWNRADISCHLGIALILCLESRSGFPDTFTLMDQIRNREFLNSNRHFPDIWDCGSGIEILSGIKIYKCFYLWEIILLHWETRELSFSRRVASCKIKNRDFILESRSNSIPTWTLSSRS